MNEPKDIQIWAEVTPNPHTLKFNLNQILLQAGSLNFTDKEKAKGSLLPEALIAIENVAGVMVGVSFVAVTKMPTADWAPLVEPIISKIRELLSGSVPLFSPEALVATQGSGASDIEQRIIDILDNEIRPAVALDGGDIIFVGFENGIVKLRMQGACRSCPSSVMTLKIGVENRLKQVIPEVKEVVQV